MWGGGGAKSEREEEDPLFLRLQGLFTWVEMEGILTLEREFNRFEGDRNERLIRNCNKL